MRQLKTIYVLNVVAISLFCVLACDENRSTSLPGASGNNVQARMFFDRANNSSPNSMVITPEFFLDWLDQLLADALKGDSVRPSSRFLSEKNFFFVFGESTDDINGTYWLACASISTNVALNEVDIVNIRATYGDGTPLAITRNATVPTPKNVAEKLAGVDNKWKDFFMGVFVVTGSFDDLEKDNQEIIIEWEGQKDRLKITSEILESVIGRRPTQGPKSVGYLY